MYILNVFRSILTCLHILILGCLSLPANAEVIEDKDGSGLAYRCVDGYELADDGKCEDVDECQLDKAVSFRYAAYRMHFEPENIDTFHKTRAHFSPKGKRCYTVA